MDTNHMDTDSTCPDERSTSGDSGSGHGSYGAKDQPITLNVGGTWHTTLPETLLKYPDSLLADIVQRPDAQESGYYFVDRDGHLFHHILSFLRTSELILPDNFQQHSSLMAEAKFYRLPTMEEALQKKKPKGTWSVIEVIEIAHPEKLGTCCARLVLKDAIAKRKPFCEIMTPSKIRREMVLGVKGRYWIRTDLTRSDWSEILLEHDWSLMGVTSFSRTLQDVSSHGTCLSYTVEKWKHE